MGKDRQEKKLELQEKVQSDRDQKPSLRWSNRTRKALTAPEKRQR
ncbi:MAG: YpzI family protein [Bacillaceae bacterium]|nr:YpzI family protein [Bacillaceae bacterium]